MSNTEQPPVLVTGSAGFIGFHVARSLLESGQRVVGYDNLNPYYSVELKCARHNELGGYGGFTPVEHDLCDRRTLDDVFRQHGPRVVCHMAAQPGVRYSLEKPMVYVHSNLEAFVSLLEASRQAAVERIVYASSSSVYGGNTEIPFREEHRVETPLNLYGATKRADELIAHAYGNLFGVQMIGLRLFTVYGPWGRPDMAVWLFAESIVEGRTIRLFNAGRMERDFTYIGDVVPAVIRALREPSLGRYEIINVGNNRSEKVTYLVELLEKELGLEANIELAPMQPGEAKATLAEVGKARQLLGFNPSTLLDEGVRHFVRWYKEYRSLPVP
jgi:UDP-glucuronate 4-epimerase